MSLDQKKPDQKKLVHKPWIYSLADLLDGIFNQHYYTDKALEIAFKNNKSWGSKDRRFIAEATYEIIRWKYRYFYTLDLPFDDTSGKHLSEDQIQLVISCYLRLHNFNCPEWLPNIQVNQLKAWESQDLPGFVKYSWDKKTFEFLSEQFAEKANDYFTALNSVAPVFLRTNSLNCTPEKLIQEIGQEFEAQLVPDVPGAVRLGQRKSVFRTEAFKNGWFEVQDGGSQLIAPFLQVQPGMRVIDACAGAGGKSLHLAALLENKGRIIALDIHQRKLDQLKLRARRAGAHCIEMKLIDSTKVIKRLSESCDRLLLDVPCTGTGVVRRNPDTKYKLSLAKIKELTEIQSDILSRYSKMVKVGGKMVYATCSLLPCENQDQIRKFLAENTNWTLEDEKILEPHLTDFDGFYAARLVKN